MAKKYTMNQGQYAEHRGVSQQTISYYKTRGIISRAINKNGLIDPDLADSILDEHLSKSQPKNLPSDTATKPEAGTGTGKARKKTLMDWQTEKEKHLARIKRLEYLEKKGKLIDGDQVKKEAFEVGRFLRDLLITEIENQAADIDAAKGPIETEKKLKELVGTVYSIAAGGADGTKTRK